jgi:hypothetical protein
MLAKTARRFSFEVIDSETSSNMQFPSVLPRPRRNELKSSRFPKRKNPCKKNNREGHEFDSCRFSLKENCGFQPLRLLLWPSRLFSPPGTYFLTFCTWHHRRLFVVDIYARLFLKTLYHYRREGRYTLRAFVLMPDHIHLLLTPAHDVTIERAVQLIKGGYSHALGTLIGRILAARIYRSSDS